MAASLETDIDDSRVLSALSFAEAKLYSVDSSSSRLSHLGSNVKAYT